MELIMPKEDEQEYTYAIEAKTEEGDDDEWLTMGDIQHVKAAEEIARIYDYDGIIHTRRKDSTTIWKHRVTRKVVYDVTPLREGS
jgi:hypothetical protein